MADTNPSMVHSAALRSCALSLEKVISIGLKSGRNRGPAPAASIAARTAGPKWLPSLSMTTMSPGTSTEKRDLIDMSMEGVAADRHVEDDRRGVPG